MLCCEARLSRRPSRKKIKKIFHTIYLRALTGLPCGGAVAVARVVEVGTGYLQTMRSLTHEHTWTEHTWAEYTWANKNKRFSRVGNSFPNTLDPLTSRNNVEPNNLAPRFCGPVIQLNQTIQLICRIRRIDKGKPPRSSAAEGVPYTNLLCFILQYQDSSSPMNRPSQPS